MKNQLMLNFTVDKGNKKILVEREFAAPLDKVWAAWTEAEILDQWWAPKPWKTETKSMDFRVGGTWFYSMVGPGGERHFCRADYKSIDDQKSFSGLDAFCDENGTINDLFPRCLWNNSFKAADDSTIVNIVVSYDSLDDLEKYIEMGFKEGFTMAMENLDELLEG